MVLCAAFAYAPIYGKAPFEPPAGKILVLIGQDNKTIEEYLDSVKIVPAGFMTYTSIQEMTGLDSKSPDYGAGTTFAGKLLKKYPGSVIQIGLYMVDGLEDTIAGKYDANIDKMAKWFKKTNCPVFLRVGYEFDGPHNHYDPETYKKAYRYTVDRLRKAGVTNVAYVWHSYAYSIKGKLDDWYPGDEYVDWVGISYFSGPKSYRDNVAAFAKALGKPVMIGEATPQGIGTSYGQVSWNRWFRDFFKYVADNDIKIISYINSNWEDQAMWQGQNWQDARVQANKIVKEKWLEEISRDKYLNASKDLYNMLK